MGIPDIVDFPLSFLIGRQDLSGGSGIDFPCLGQIDPPGFPYQQGQSRLLFQFPDDPAQGRLGQLQFPGRRRDIFLFTDGQEIPQVFFVENDILPPISFLL